MHHLIIPGWHGSAGNHWQTHWHRTLPVSSRLQQDDWDNPLREHWVARLDECLAGIEGPVLLIAHSLGCNTVACWAQTGSEHLPRIAGALLVAPGDVDHPQCPPELTSFAPVPRQALGFPALVVASDNDYAASERRARQMAADWAADFHLLAGAAHINSESGHHQWKAGWALLQRLTASG